MRMRRALAVILVGLLPAFRAVSGDAQQAPPTFSDVTKAAGIRFVHDSGAFGKKYLPETMGSGGAFLDIDNDGWQDILLVNAMSWPGRPAKRSVMALYRNNRDGTFSDITASAGLAVPMYGMGVAAADYDNDGRVDIYVTALGRNRLFRNLGGGEVQRMSPTRQASAIRGSRRVRPGSTTTGTVVSTSSSANYVDWSIEKDLFCTLDGKTKSYCTPESYKGQSLALFHNRGDGTFEDTTGPRRAQGLRRRRRLAWRSSIYNDDGWIDLFVANDTQPNRLYESRRTARSPTWRRGRRRLQRGRRRARRHGRRRGRLRRVRAAEPRHRQLLERDDGALYQRGQRPLHRRGARVDDRADVAAQR